MRPCEPSFSVPPAGTDVPAARGDDLAVVLRSPARSPASVCRREERRRRARHGEAGVGIVALRPFGLCRNRPPARRARCRPCSAGADARRRRGRAKERRDRDDELLTMISGSRAACENAAGAEGGWRNESVRRSRRRRSRDHMQSNAVKKATPAGEIVAKLPGRPESRRPPPPVAGSQQPPGWFANKKERPKGAPSLSGVRRNEEIRGGSGSGRSRSARGGSARCSRGGTRRR